MTSLIFIQTFGNFSFVCNYWTYLFGSYWVVLSKYQKTMASLLFIVYWCKHIFLMIIQIFTENILPLIFEPLISWTKLIPHVLMIIQIFTENILPLIFEPLISGTQLIPHVLAFWEIYILITYWWPVSIPKTSYGV